MVPEDESTITCENSSRALEQQAGKSHLQPQTQNPEWTGSELQLNLLRVTSSTGPPTVDQVLRYTSLCKPPQLVYLLLRI